MLTILSGLKKLFMYKKFSHQYELQYSESKPEEGYNGATARYGVRLKFINSAMAYTGVNLYSIIKNKILDEWI